MSSDVVVAGTVIITPLLKAQKKLKESIDIASNELERNGAIQRFEYTYELVWKMLRKALITKGLTVNNPRDIFREAAQQGLVQDPLVWFSFITMRNKTTHTYDEETAEEIFGQLRFFAQEVDKVINALKKMH